MADLCIEGLTEFKIVRGDFKPLSLLVEKEKSDLLSTIKFSCTQLEIVADFTKNTYDTEYDEWKYEIPSTATASANLGIYTFDITVIFTENSSPLTSTGNVFEIIEKENEIV